VSPEGSIVDSDTWAANRAAWLPTGEDEQFVRSLMQAVTEPGKMAGWIAPPAAGINGKPVEFEYVRVG
jgi:benzoyl-CoA 2,3-dioxygenase component B